MHQAFIHILTIIILKKSIVNSNFPKAINNSQRVNYLMPELNNGNNSYINQYNSKISNLKTSPKNYKYSQISP
jgi:hypothetical protein